MRGFVLSMLAALTLASTGAQAASCTATSGERTLALLELYTSEGCDSCPPADRWLSGAIPPGGSEVAVALAFHVDYWDRLGWTDRFASPRWTDRQRAVASANKSMLVYTPQVVLQGRDFSAWRKGGVERVIADEHAKPARAQIGLAATIDNARVNVTMNSKVPSAALRKGAALYVAYTDSGLVSDVKAGENRGVRLLHDHVVRALEGGTKVDAEGNAKLETAFSVPKETGRAPTLVAFVQNPANGDVLQALALPLTACR